MAAMSAMGHVLLVDLDDGIDALWDLLDEMAVRYGTEKDGVLVHSLPPEDGRRYCVHPSGRPQPEFRGDDLREVMLEGATWLAQQLGDEMWSRD